MCASQWSSFSFDSLRGSLARRSCHSNSHHTSRHRTAFGSRKYSGPQQDGIKYKHNNIKNQASILFFFLGCVFALAVEVCFLPPLPSPPSPDLLPSRVVSRLRRSDVKHTERRESAKVNKRSCAIKKDILPRSQVEER